MCHQIVADIKEKIIFEHSGATLDEAAVKLEKVMDTYKSEKADMLMFFPYEKPDHHIGKMEVQDESWCRVTLGQRNIEDGVFKRSLYSKTFGIHKLNSVWTDVPNSSIRNGKEKNEC